LFLYVKGILSFDLGFSFRQQTPVSKLIMDRLPATLLLTMTAFAISLLLGILLGTLAARWAGTWADTAITVLALVFYATPLFWIALMAILLFSWRWIGCRVSATKQSARITPALPMCWTSARI